jgi:flagellin
MSLLVTNSADANHYFKINQRNLQASLKKLSSGKRIINGSEDPGGLAVAMKLSSSIKRLAAAENNVQNGISFLEVQDGLLDTVGGIVTRISELKGLVSDDPLKSGTDKESYQAEYEELVNQLSSIKAMRFNGVTLFDDEDTSDKNENLSISIDDSGNNTVEISLANLGHEDMDAVFYDNSDDDNILSLEDDVTIDVINAALNHVAKLRGGNGSGQNRLRFIEQSLSLQKTNMFAALDRLEGIDLAEEAANMAKHSILLQSSAAMVSQANGNRDIALMLLN